MKRIIIWAFFLYLFAGLADTVLAMCGIPEAGMLAVVVVGTMIPLGIIVGIAVVIVGWKEDERERERAERAEREYITESARW